MNINQTVLRKKHKFLVKLFFILIYLNGKKINKDLDQFIIICMKKSYRVQLTFTILF